MVAEDFGGSIELYTGGKGDEPEEDHGRPERKGIVVRVRRHGR